MSKLKYSVVAVLLIILISYVLYPKYEQYRFINSITPTVKMSTLRISNQLSTYINGTLETPASRNTEEQKLEFNEIYANIKLDILEIKNTNLQIQSISTPRTLDKSILILNYLESGQTLLEAIEHKYALSLKVSSISDGTKKLIPNNSEDPLERAMNEHHFAKSIDEIKLAVKEWQSSESEIFNSLQVFNENQLKVASVISSDALVNDQSLGRALSSLKTRNTN